MNVGTCNWLSTTPAGSIATHQHVQRHISRHMQGKMQAVQKNTNKLLPLFDVHRQYFCDKHRSDAAPSSTRPCHRPPPWHNSPTTDLASVSVSVCHTAYSHLPVVSATTNNLTYMHTHCIRASERTNERSSRQSMVDGRPSSVSHRVRRIFVCEGAAKQSKLVRSPPQHQQTNTRDDTKYDITYHTRTVLVYIVWRNYCKHTGNYVISRNSSAEKLGIYRAKVKQQEHNTVYKNSIHCNYHSDIEKRSFRVFGRP